VDTIRIRQVEGDEINLIISVDLNKLGMDRVDFLASRYNLVSVTPNYVATHVRANTLDGVWVSLSIKVISVVLKRVIRKSQITVS